MVQRRDWAKYITPGQLPNYEVVPLRSDTIGVAACQVNPLVFEVDPKNPKKVQRENLAKMLFMCDYAEQFPGSFSTFRMPKVDLLVFPEFAFTGFNAEWTRDEFQQVAIEVPGEETEIIGKKAKELNCYIAFGAHIKEKDWPGHCFNTSIIIGPSGEVIHKHWKAYRPGAGVFEWSTTVHDVLDEFVERYGWDAVWPVARTDIGNLATYICSEGFCPETARIYAFKGCEILCRVFAGGGPELSYGKYRLQFRADCAFSMVYGVYGNGMNGGSMIVDYFGRIMNECVDNRETVVYDRIPIAQYRSEHARPWIRTEIYAPPLTQNPGRWPPNLYSKYGFPYNSDEAFRIFEENSRFWSPWNVNC